MSTDENVFANIPDGLKTTAAAAAFVENVTLDDIPAEAMRLGTRCLLDGLGLFVAGSEERSVGLLIEEAQQMGGRPDALLLGCGETKVPAPIAAQPRVQEKPVATTPVVKESIGQKFKDFLETWAKNKSEPESYITALFGVSSIP